MVPSLVRSILFGVICITALAISSYAHSEPASPVAPPSPAIPPVDQLPAMAVAAKAEFRPVTADDLKKAKAALAEAVARLDGRLKADGKNGEQWRQYLHWGQIAAQIQPDKQPDLDALDEIHRRLSAGHEGLGLKWFIDARTATDRYRKTARNLANTELKAAYEKLLDGLAEFLKVYAAKPTAEEAIVIGTAVAELETAGQAPALLNAIRHHYTHPNLFMEVSDAVIIAGIAGPVDDTQPVRDFILGTNIYGTGRTTGQTTAELVPDERFGVVDAVLSAFTATRTTGYNGPATIHATGTTGIGAKKRLWIDAEGIHSHPAAADAWTRTRLQGVSARGALIQRIAQRSAARQKGQADAIAGQHAESRAGRQMDERAAKNIADANKSFQGQFRVPLVERGLFPQLLRFSTTKQALQVVSLRADSAQLAASGGPPPVPAACDMAMRVHESLVNNLASSALAGMTVSDKTFQATLESLSGKGKVPERFTPDDDEPFAINLNRYRPFFVVFADDGYNVTLRGHRYYKGASDYPAMDVTARYKFVKDDKGIKAVRQGDLEIFPPDFTPGGEEKLSPLQINIKASLQRRFGKIFSPEILVDPIALPDPWSKAGQMVPKDVVSRDGWLTMTWNLAPAPKTATQK